MAGNQISTSVTILNSLHGFMALSLTEYATSAAAAIAAGSVVEIAGAFFTFAGDEAINASSWTSIVTGTTAYITLTASGTAGSQIVDAAYTSTAPTWRDDFQGWYASAASSVRVIGTVYKAEATSYYPKFIYGPIQDGKQTSISVNGCSVASSLSVAGRLTVDGSIYDKNGQEVLALRATTESFVKFSNAYTATTLTTISLVKGITHISYNLSTDGTVFGRPHATVNSGIMSAYSMESVATTLTYVVSYLY